MAPWEPPFYDTSDDEAVPAFRPAKLVNGKVVFTAAEPLNYLKDPPLAVTKATGGKVVLQKRLPCTNCIRSMTSETFMQNPYRCSSVCLWRGTDVKPIIEMCNECSRNGLSQCVSVRFAFYGV